MDRRAVPPFVLAAALAAQGPPHNGPRPVDPGWYALVGGRVVTAPDKAPEPLTIVLRGGRIEAVGGDAPKGATPIDCSGLVIYAGLVEPFLPVDVPSLDPATGDLGWNPSVQPQRRALEAAPLAPAEREGLYTIGYTAAGIVPSGGVCKGLGAVVLLDEPGETEKPRVVREASSVVVSLQTRRDGGYPNSEMGAHALLRQTLLDALWYERCITTLAAHPELGSRAPQPSAGLQALVDHKSLPLWCDSQDELQELRLLRLAAEFERPVVLVGSGMEFRRIGALGAAKPAIVVPLNFPEAPRVDSAGAAEQVSLRHLQSWEQAPTNSKRLLDAGATIAWTSARLRDRKEARARMRDAIACGVTPAQALAAVTTTPAKLLGVEARLGTIEPGKLANLTVCTGDLFAEASEVREVWIGGRRRSVTPAKDRGLDGTWTLTGLPGAAGELVLEVAGDKVTLRSGEKGPAVAAVVREPERLQFTTLPWSVRLWREGDELRGNASGLAAAGQAELRAVRRTAEVAAEQPAARPPFEPPPSGPLPVPLGGYGRLTPPAAGTFAIVGAELWTCDARGIVQDGAVLVRDGKITFVGPARDLPALPPGTPTIDAKGKHLTPGLIDCHSHTGISRGINESGQAVTAEVSVQDVIDPDDVNWYRQLAGGVTAVNQLHGSANPIGGQSSTVKLRWGVAHPDEMRFLGAPGGIKWALGENPRRANGPADNPRYPNTRMGVEALLRDRLAAADAYRKERAAYEALPPAGRAAVLPPRRDLELDALAEVLAGSRRIHCHSYRQDEITMLCQLAGEYGVRIGTFQHVLEGYKVADAIAQHAIGASSFSDWWAYKFEVFDAIPENAAILHEQGVLVSINSDSNEHARRLNTEAGKAVKYGRVPPQQALCFVTANPAIQLGVFERTGSLTVGKDADLALWSDDPLSYRARCEATWVDGRLQWSLEQDHAARGAIAAERQRLLPKALAAGTRGNRRGARDKDAYFAAEHSTTDQGCRDCAGGR